MPQLDKLIARLESGVASAIVLESDSPIALQTAMGLQQFSSQVLSVSQVLALISEVADADVRPSIQSGRDIRFTYQFNGKPWLVQQDNNASGVRIQVRAWSERDNGAETPKPLNTAPRGVASVTPTAASATPAVAPLAESSRSVPRRADDAPIAASTGHSDARSALDALLRIQVSRGAADLHLRVGEPPIFRLGGDLVRLEGEEPLTPEGLEAMLRSIMPVKNQGEYDELWDTDFAYEIEGLSRFRVNVLRDRYGMAAVMRTIASTTVTVEQMGISPEVQALCNLTKGLVLVTGPTGSGKSTTLCALVDLINRTRSDHLITIEDPIEFVHQSKKCLITQRQVGVHTQSFKSALRAALREDPDIILVGELRDLETIAIAMETAETGHLVFGTLHTSTAASTINRIVDQFPADRQEQIRIMLSESLKAVVSQVLCRKIGGGRVAAREILIVNKAVSALIREGKTVQIPNIIQTQRKLGMETLNDALLNLVKTKQVEPEEAYNKAVEKKDMAMKLKAIGHNIASAGLDE